jgi:hypothetical protein
VKGVAEEGAGDQGDEGGQDQGEAGDEGGESGRNVHDLFLT